jgi:hypothetical protein
LKIDAVGQHPRLIPGPSPLGEGGDFVANEEVNITMQILFIVLSEA